MNRSIIALLAVLVVASTGVGNPPSEEEVEPVRTPPQKLIKEWTEVIREHCPDARIEVTKKGFIAKHDTMQFTLHGRGKDGVARKETHRREGPNDTGFLLEISYHDDGYGGVYGGPFPGLFEEPYFNRYFDVTVATGGKKHYWINFYIGKNLDPKLKRAILDSIPKTKNPEAPVPVTTPPPEEMIQTMTDAIRKQCPEAKIEVTKDAFIARHETMMFTVHPRADDGEISEETQEVEGPNRDGFLLKVKLVHAGFGQFDKAQTIKEPYFPRFTDRQTIEHGTKHYQVDFAYHWNLNQKLKKAILDVVPKSKTQLSE